MRIGYVIPEFPSQTHVWIWREIVHVRAWQLPLTIFSTQRPAPKDRARHAFAAEAERETVYLWPRPRLGALLMLLGALLRSPAGFARCVSLAFTLERTVNRGKVRPLLPLVLPACILAREVRRRGITHLHSHSVARSAVVCMMVRRLTGTPYSLTLNADLTWWGGGVERKIAESAFTIAITQGLLEEVHAKFPGIPAERTILGRIGVDTRRWRRPAERPLPVEPRVGYRIVSVGRLHTNKAFDVLMQAARRLTDEGVPLEVRIIGDGSERQSLEALRTRLQLEGIVTLLGSMSEDEIIDELLDAHLFSAVSRHEPLGVVYMEAMALGVPTLGTTSGGVGEIIDHERNGLLVEPGDPDALAGAILNLLRHPELRRQFAVEGRRAIVEKFDSRIGAATVYEKLTGCPAPVDRDALSEPAHQASRA